MILLPFSVAVLAIVKNDLRITWEIHTIGVCRGCQSCQGPPKILSCLVDLCIEMRCPKQVLLLASIQIFGTSQNFGLAMLLILGLKAHCLKLHLTLLKRVEFRFHSDFLYHLTYFDIGLLMWKRLLIPLDQVIKKRCSTVQQALDKNGLKSPNFTTKISKLKF